MPQLDLSWFLINFFIVWIFSIIITLYLKNNNWTNTNNNDNNKTNTNTNNWNW